MDLFEALRHWKELDPSFAVANLSERPPPRWLVVGFAVVLDPSGSEAYLAVEGTDSSGSEAYLAGEEIDSFDLEACPAVEGIGPEECFVAVGHPWQFVEALQAGVPLLEFGSCRAVDEPPLRRRRRNFFHQQLLVHRGRLSLCLQNCQRVKSPDAPHIQDKICCRLG